MQPSPKRQQPNKEIGTPIKGVPFFIAIKINAANRRDSTILTNVKKCENRAARDDITRPHITDNQDLLTTPHFTDNQVLHESSLVSRISVPID